MATTVAQHSIATFTSPINGTTPIDANSVRGNDNTIRSSYNDHDADAGIHLQSSALSARPVAGDAGRKWLTNDTGAVRLYLDTGSAWAEISYLPLAGGTVAGNVSVTGTLAVTGVLTASGGVVGNITGNADTATKLSSSRTFAVTGDVTGSVSSDLTTGASIGTTLASGVVSNTNVSASAAIAYSKLALTGSIVNADVSASAAIADTKLATISTAGKVANSATTAVSTNTANAIVARDASGNFAAGTITAALTGNASTATTLQTARTINGVSFNGSADITVAAAAGTLTGTTLASNVTASSLTSVGTLANLTVTNPITGSVTGSSGSTTGNAATATALQTARTINGVSFNGTADITVAAAAGTLTGTTLASNVVSSSLTSVGTLSTLTVSGNTNLATSSGRVIVGNTTGTNYKLESYAAAGNNGITVNIGSDTGTDFAALDFRQNTAQKAVFYTNNNNLTINTLSGSTIFQIGSSDRMRLDTSGNLGLGVTPSAWSGFKAVQNQRASVASASTDTYFSHNWFWNGTADTYIATDFAVRYGMVNGQHRWFTAPSGTAGNAITFTQAMTLDASGNLGVGTASPATRLHVDTVSAGYGITVAANGQTARRYQFGVDTNSNFAIYESVAAAQRIVLDQSGNLGLGVTPSAWSGFGLPVLELPSGGTVMAAGPSATVGSNWYYSGSSFLYKTSAAAAYYLQSSGQHRWYSAPSGTAGNAITFTQAMTLDASGNVGIGTTTLVERLRLKASNTTGSSIYSYFNCTNEVDADFQVSVTGSASTDKRVSIGPSTGTSMTFVTSGTERARFDTAGSLLVGQTSSSSSVYRIETNNATDNRFGMNVGGVLTGALQATSNEMKLLAAGASGVLTFQTNANERARFDTAGNLLVGMTATATSSAKTLHLANATVPTANPTGGGVLYVEAGALKYRGSSGTITTIANA